MLGKQCRPATSVPIGRAYCLPEGRYKIHGRIPSIGMKLDNAHFYISPRRRSNREAGYRAAECVGWLNRRG
jgi:hypothetical protein